MGFKLLILTENNVYYVSDELERYIFSSKFRVDMTNILDENSTSVVEFTDIKKHYEVENQISSFLVRLTLTILIELGIALLFKYHKKKELLIILMMNIVTQLMLNGM